MRGLHRVHENFLMLFRLLFYSGDGALYLDIVLKLSKASDVRATLRIPTTHTEDVICLFQVSLAVLDEC